MPISNNPTAERHGFGRSEKVTFRGIPGVTASWVSWASVPNDMVPVYLEAEERFRDRLDVTFILHSQLKKVGESKQVIPVKYFTDDAGWLYRQHPGITDMVILVATEGPVDNLTISGAYSKSNSGIVPLYRAV